MYEITMAVKKQLSADAQLTAMLGNRIYPGRNMDKALKTDYPCMALAGVPGEDGQQAATVSKMLRFDLWSKNGYDELWAVYNRVKALLDLKTLLASSGQFLFLTEILVNDSCYDNENTSYHLTAQYLVAAACAKPYIDAWVAATGKWAGTVLDNWEVLCNTWCNLKSLPAVRLVLNEMSIKQDGGERITVTKKIAARFIGRTADEQLMAAGKLAQAAGIAHKIPLDIVQKNYMTLQAVEVNAANNPLGPVQVVFTVSQSIMRAAAERTLIKKVEIKSTIN